jgi:hypothetical protein
MKALGEALAAWVAERGVHDDVSGVPLRTLWLGAPADHSNARPSRLRPAGEVPTPVSRRARTEDLVVASSLHFASAAGYGEKSARSRNLMMGGIALLAGVLAWKIAFSPVGPAAAAYSALAVPVPVPTPVVTATVAPIASAPAAVKPAAIKPAAPRVLVAKPIHAPVRAPAPLATATPDAGAAPMSPAVEPVMTPGEGS